MTGGAGRPATTSSDAFILSQAVPFLEALLALAPRSHYLEIRAIAPNKDDNRQHFHKISDLFTNGMATALPLELDGKANIYYGVCPRVRKQGTADAVEIATAAWFDEITCPAPDLRPFSWLIQTSTGKVQGGYFLKRPTRNVDRIERLNRRLRAMVGGDNVGDRARILRLPGFLNVKYQNERAILLELRPGGVV